MRVVRLASPDAFAARCKDFLTAREDENSLMLGVITGGGAWRDGGPLCVSVEAGDRLMLAGLRTPPFNLLLSAGAADAAAYLATDLAAQGEALSGVIAIEGLAERFTEAWTAAGAGRRRKTTEMILHRLDEVRVAAEVSGDLKRVRPEDADFFGEWNERASRDMGLSDHEIATARRTARRRIEEGQVYAWYRRGEPVSLAAFQPTSFTGTTGRINMVYTPPPWRGRGYATACVAALTAERLAAGWRSCLIFTDKHNATTNKIYRRIGYEVLATFLNVDFRAT